MTDDPVIPDWEVLLRRVIINRNSAAIDSDGRLRLTTAGFKLDDDGVSLYRSQILQIMGYGSEEVAANRVGAVPVALMVGHVRSAGGRVCPDPIPIPKEPVDPAHALLTFDESLSSGRKKQCLRDSLERSFVLSRALEVTGGPEEPTLTVSPPSSRRGLLESIRSLGRAGKHARRRSR